MGISQEDQLIAKLESDGDYKILRRLKLMSDPRIKAQSAGQKLGTRIGICLDTETTGFNALTDKIIEIGIVSFEYVPSTGEIVRVLDRYSAFEDPGVPLSEEVKHVTGITDEQLKGQAFNDVEVTAFAEKASLVICHNSGFDRLFMEKRFPAFIKKAWACTLSQIDWKKEYITSRSLDYLLFRCGGCFIDAHRALNDAEGVLGLLLSTLPATGRSVFQVIREQAAAPTCKVMAVGAPFEAKDVLKDRGYCWNDGANGKAKAWWTDIAESAVKEEMAFLGKNVFRHGNTSTVVVSKIDAYDRFSSRAG